jgi:hypothetical protein
LVWVQLGAG